MTKHDENESGVQQLDRLVQENEGLQTKVKKLEGQLNVARELLKPKWKEHEKLLVVFGDAPAVTAQSAMTNGDPLARFRPVLEGAPREAHRKVAQAIVDMEGRATVKQLCAATGYSSKTVRGSVTWLAQHRIVHRDGPEAVFGE